MPVTTATMAAHAKHLLSTKTCRAPLSSQPIKTSVETRTTQLSFYYTTMTANVVIPADVADDSVIPEEGYGSQQRRAAVAPWYTDSGMTGVRMVRKGCLRPIYIQCTYLISVSTSTVAMSTLWSSIDPELVWSWSATFHCSGVHRGWSECFDATTFPERTRTSRIRRQLVRRWSPARNISHSTMPSVRSSRRLFLVRTLGR
jgi:hypothetical protein